MGYADKLYDIAVNKKAPANQAWSDRPELWMQAGLPMTTGRAATSSPVEAAVSLISTDIATLPIRVMEQQEDGTSIQVRNSPVARVLAKPNEYQSRVDFITGVMRDLFFYGNAYAWQDVDSRGQIRAIYPLRPRQVQPFILPDGDVYYSVALTELELGERAQQRTQEQVLVPASQILHHRVFTANHPLLGISPLYALGPSAAMTAAINENLANFHANAARPGGLLVAPGGLKAETRDRLREDFARTFTGANSGKLAVLDVDVRFEPLTFMKAGEQQVAELLKHSVEDVARALRIPIHMLMGGQGQSGAGVEAANRLYYSHALRPHIESLENRFDDFFGFTGTSRYIEFDLEQIFRAESDRRIDALTKGVQGGILTPNEARKSEGLPPVDGGDDAYLQRQMTSMALLRDLNAAELTAAASPQSSPAPDPASVSPPTDTDQERSIDVDDLTNQMRLALQTRSLAREVRPQPKKINAADIAAEIRKELAK